MKAATVAKIFINEIVARHGAPSTLLSDQGANFTSDLIAEICKFFQTIKQQTAPYNPKCDGLVERFNRTLCDMLKAYSNTNQSNWDLYLPIVLFAYRTSEQATTKRSPFELLYGREARIGDLDNYNSGYIPSKFIEDLYEEWKEAKKLIKEQGNQSKETYDNRYKRPPIQYNVGNQVRVYKPQTKAGLKTKLRNDLWSDKVEVVEVPSKQNVKILLPKGKQKIVNIEAISKRLNQ